MSAVRADVPMSLGEISGVLGWPPERTRRWLDGLASKDPSIIVRVRGRRMVTLASLRRVCPDIAKRFATDRDIDEIRDEQREQRYELELVASKVHDFRKQSWEWYQAVVVRLDAIENRQRGS